MIQRIQSVYLLIVTVLLVVTMCVPMGTYTHDDGSVSEFMNIGVYMQSGIDYTTWGLFAILALSAIIAFATIFLFKNRILQIRMTVFNSILLIGYYFVLIIFRFLLENKLGGDYHLSWGVCLPLIAIILNYLAIRGIGKDEVLVKATDRLR